MATLVNGGSPQTILLDEAELLLLAQSTRPARTLAAIKAEHGLPNHAPHGVASPEWALPLNIEFDMKWKRRDGGWYCVREIKGESTVYLTRHSAIG